LFQSKKKKPCLGGDATRALVDKERAVKSFLRSHPKKVPWGGKGGSHARMRAFLNKGEFEARKEILQGRSGFLEKNQDRDTPANLDQ